jgi:hypothetical protein
MWGPHKLELSKYPRTSCKQWRSTNEDQEI